MNVIVPQIKIKRKWKTEKSRSCQRTEKIEKYEVDSCVHHYKYAWNTLETNQNTDETCCHLISSNS